MDKNKFEKAIALKEKIEYYQKHKEQLEKSNIRLGGKLVFTHKEGGYMTVDLYNELFDNSFFKSYMDTLNNKIETLQKEFDEL